MLPVLWRTRARSSLIQINSYIADRNPVAAQRLKDAIEQAVAKKLEALVVRRSVAAVRQRLLQQVAPGKGMAECLLKPISLH